MSAWQTITFLQTYLITHPTATKAISPMPKFPSLTTLHHRLTAHDPQSELHTPSTASYPFRRPRPVMPTRGCSRRCPAMLRTRPPSFDWRNRGICFPRVNRSAPFTPFPDSPSHRSRLSSSPLARHAPPPNDSRRLHTPSHLLRRSFTSHLSGTRPSHRSRLSSSPLARHCRSPLDPHLRCRFSALPI